MPAERVAVLEYVTQPTTGTVHLTQPFGSQDRFTTLCGRFAGEMQSGDETPYGAQATCRRCLALRRSVFAVQHNDGSPA